MSMFKTFLKEESGASAAEYVLILAIIGTAIAASMLAFGSSIAGALDKASAKIAGLSY